MQNFVGKYIYSQWKHNEGFTQNWLRRVTRQTATQIVCDVRHTLLLTDKYKKKYDAGSDYSYVRCAKWAKRFRIKGEQLLESITHLHNTDGVRTVNFVSDFSSLLCKHKYEELFEIDIRTILPADSSMLKDAKSAVEIYCEGKPDTFEVFDERFHKVKTELVPFEDELSGDTAKHLFDLFSVPVYKIKDYVVKVDTIHDHSVYAYSAIHYHLNHHGNDEKILTRRENQKNRTISFWLFEDRVVYRVEDGIGSW